MKITQRARSESMIKSVAKALGTELCEQLVFVGGCAVFFYITDEVVHDELRATDDVDLIVSLSDFSQWSHLQEHLSRLGFTASYEDEVICRMRLNGLKVDFMPDDEGILGFSNRWYKMGIETSKITTLSQGINIRILQPEMFVATKLEAYDGRGDGDPMGSKDIEDVIVIVNGRPEIIEEIANADDDVKSYVSQKIRDLMDDPNFEICLEGNVLEGPERAEIVRGRFDEIARLEVSPLNQPS